VSDDKAEPYLGSLAGRALQSCRRVVFEVRGRRQSSDGPLELTLDNGQVLLFQVGPDGESLIVSTTTWHDPFSDRMTSENSEFTRLSGRWIVSDVCVPSLEEVIGKPIIGVQTIHNSLSRLTGTILDFPNYSLIARVVADELKVSIE
jgi:hypothetical protein